MVLHFCLENLGLERLCIPGQGPVKAEHVIKGDSHLQDTNSTFTPYLRMQLYGMAITLAQSARTWQKAVFLTKLKGHAKIIFCKITNI